MYPVQARYQENMHQPFAGEQRYHQMEMQAAAAAGAAGAPGGPGGAGGDDNGSACCCNTLCDRVCNAVADFFIFFAKAIWSALTWIVDNIICCECLDDDGDVSDRPNFNSSAPFREEPFSRAPNLPPVQPASRWNAQPNAAQAQNVINLVRDLVEANNPLALHEARGSRVNADGWQILTPEQMIEMGFGPPGGPQGAPVSAQVAPADAPAPAEAVERPVAPPMSRETLQKQQAALTRITQIKASLALGGSRIQYEIHPTLISFDCDKELRKFSTHGNINRLKDLLTYAGVEPSKLEGENHAKFARDQAHANAVFARRTAQLAQVINNHETGIHRRMGMNVPGFSGEKVEHAKQSLNQLFHIYAAKMQKANNGQYDKEKLKKEIRLLVDGLADAYENCIDQINFFLEIALIRSAATELGRPGISETNIVGAHALFEYRVRLLTEIIEEVNRIRCTRLGLPAGQWHTADLDREIKKSLAVMLNIESRVTGVGANYRLFADINELTEEAREKFFARYNNPPARSPDPRIPTLDGRPLGYLEAFLPEALEGNPTDKLRRLLLDWIQKEFRLESTPDGMHYANDTITEIVEAISDPEDPVGDVLMGGKLNSAGVKWILEASGITRVLR